MLFVRTRARHFCPSPCQRLAQENLDLGVYAAQIGCGEALYRGEDLGADA